MILSLLFTKGISSSTYFEHYVYMYYEKREPVFCPKDCTKGCNDSKPKRNVVIFFLRVY